MWFAYRGADGLPFREKVAKPLCVVGRGPGCDLFLDEANVSRRHASISEFNGKFLLTDLESSNGTAVNGIPAERQFIRPGDRLWFGTFECTFLGEEADDTKRRTP